MCTDFYNIETAERVQWRSRSCRLWRCLKSLSRIWLSIVTLCVVSANAAADEPGTGSVWSIHTVQDAASREFVQTYALGVGEYETDDFTTVTGWRFNDSWHLGYQDGEDSGLSLVWQKSRDQMSFSHHGIRFTRRF